MEIPISTGNVRIDVTTDRQVTLAINNVPSSAISLNDPRFLAFEYMQQMDCIVDSLRPGSIRALHLGAGACSLAWAWALKHPKSRQIAVDIDEELVRLIRQWFELPAAPALRIRAQDARAAIATTKPNNFDVIVRDVFSGNQTPTNLTTDEFGVSVRHALKEGGIYLANCADKPPLNEVRKELETLNSVFGANQTALVAERGIINGKRYGNLTLIARKWTNTDRDNTDRDNTAEPLPALDNPALARALRSLAVPAVIISGDELAEFLARRKVRS